MTPSAATPAAAPAFDPKGDLTSVVEAAPARIGAETKKAQTRALAGAKTAGARAAPKADALAKRALVCVDAHQYRDAVRFALKATEIDPDNLVALIVGAVALDRLGELSFALSFYERALKVDPANPDIAALLGDTAGRVGERELAEQFYRAAVSLAPQDATYANNLAGALRDNGRYDDAVELLRSHLYVAPEAYDLWNTLGTVLHERGDAEQAITFLTEAIRLHPGHARALHNLANALADLGQWEQSVDALDSALALGPPPMDVAEMRHARGFSLFGVGRVSEGWDNWRARFDPLIHEPTHFVAPWPRWAGEDIAGKRILVLGEQGLGDEVMFMNAMADLVAGAGPAGKVVIGCERRLAPLVARSFPSAEVRPHATVKKDGKVIRGLADDIALEAIDLWTPMGEVAAHFRKAVSDFPPTPSYFVADPDKIAQWAERLSELGPGLKVGVMWKSLVMSAKRRRAFAPFVHWRDVLTTPGAHFVSLQYGDVTEEMAMAANAFGAKLHVLEGLNPKDDLDDLAALSCALDLVISPPNATSNIAAAAGADVWMVQHAQAWPMLGTAHMPWYPKARVFAGKSLGQWADLYAEIAQALRVRAAQA